MHLVPSLRMGDDLVERGLDLYKDATRALHERGAPTWYEVELSMAQIRALFTLVDRLVEQGLAGRREDALDRRRTLAQPTEAGEALAQRLRQGSREALRSWLERMAPADLEALVRGLEALVAIAGAPFAGPAREPDRVGVEG